MDSHKSGKLFALTHNYTGNSMVKQAKAMVKNGDLGNIRKIQVQYLQGWLSTAVEKTDNKQASWRTDPKRSGIGGALGDIGTHAENLVEYITGLKIDELAADLGRFGEGRRGRNQGPEVEPERSGSQIRGWDSCSTTRSPSR